MVSDTDTKKTDQPAEEEAQDKRSRWFRLAAPVRPDLPEIGPIFDLYWGGPERRITGITLRIIGVNALALLILMFGILYMGQYQSSLIEARLETFETELDLISASLSEGAVNNEVIDTNTAKIMAERLSETSRQRIRIFDQDSILIIDTRTNTALNDTLWAEEDREQTDFRSIEILFNMARFLLDLLPESRALPLYPEITAGTPSIEIPDVQDALKSKTSLSVWETENVRIFLSAAAPINVNNQTIGAVLLTREGVKIEKDITAVWVNVLRVFLITLVLTVLLSIYLSGVIARPLRRLANAAEAVRRGKASAEDIPDLSDRHDEIGELSLVLREMTSALWERMDATERFAADVAHELKNPLTSVKSAIETAAIVKKPADRKKLMDIIRHDVDRLDRLITDIANASRIDTELSREAFEKVSLRTLLGNLLDSYAADPLTRNNSRTEENSSKWERHIQGDNARLTLSSLADNDIQVWGMEERLAQVFQNLLANAVSFSPNKGSISVLVIPSTSAQNTVSITITDEGPGIPDNKIKTIFERFYSERPDHESYGQHSGLGLSICKQIIEAHRGQIFAENVKDKNEHVTGARFTVVLNTV